MTANEQQIVQLPIDLNPQITPYSFADERVRCEDNIRQIMVDEQPVRLTKIESSLLAMLGSNPNKVVDHQLLLRAAWGKDSLLLPNHVLLDTLKVHINNIRNKLGRDDLGANPTGSIRVYRGIGYSALKHLEKQTG